MALLVCVCMGRDQAMSWDCRVERSLSFKLDKTWLPLQECQRLAAGSGQNDLLLQKSHSDTAQSGSMSVKCC